MRVPSGVRQDVSTTKKSFNSSIACFSGPPSELEARQEVNDLRMLSGFEVYAKCSAASSKEIAGAVESWI